MSITKILEDIEAQLEEDLANLAEMEQDVAGMRERVSRLRKALRDLKGEPPPGKPRGRPRKSERVRPPSTASIQAVMVTLSEADEPLSVKMIEERAQRSHSNIDATVRYLRAHEMIRLAGRRGMAHVYALMDKPQARTQGGGSATNAV
jgi:hypothetical protein